MPIKIYKTQAFNKIFLCFETKHKKHKTQTQIFGLYAQHKPRNQHRNTTYTTNPQTQKSTYTTNPDQQKSQPTNPPSEYIFPPWSTPLSWEIERWKRETYRSGIERQRSLSWREFELFRSEFERIVRESVGRLVKEKKRTTASCGVGGSGDE